MFNPNSIDQLAAAVADDLQFLGMTVGNNFSSLLFGGQSPIAGFHVLNATSTTAAKVRFRNVDGEAVCTVSRPVNGYESNVRYDGEMESFSRAVCKAIVHQALRQREATRV